MKKFFVNRIFRTLLCATFLTTTNAQSGPELLKLTPPSPNVMAMQKYGDIPVSAYTGVPNISIPIYNVKFKDISFPISLSYHASGIKVAEDASQVGLGWVLNAGGMISRNILGFDDFPSLVYFDTLITDFSNGTFPRDNVTRGCNLNMISSTGGQTSYPYDISNKINGNPLRDFQPDQFYYNYPGHSGKFLLKRNYQPVLQKQENIQITCPTNGSSFQIKSDDGYIYDFNAVETFTDAVPHNSAWYLTKITSPTGNSVTFTYTTLVNTIQPVGSFTETRDDADLIYPGGTPDVPQNWGYQHGLTPGKLYKSLILSSIDFTNGKVQFYYSGNRTDLPNDQQLDSICIYNQGATQLIKTFQFSHGYFSGTVDPAYGTVGNTIFQRLKLSQITEKGYFNGQSIVNPPYIFTYNESALPSKTSFGRDHWGYYNGITGRGTLIPDAIIVNSSDPVIHALGLTGLQREANPYYTGVFSLLSIKYPAGGLTEFQFESNDYDEAASEVNDHSYFEAILGQVTPVQKSIQFIYNATTHQYTTSTTLNLTNIYIDGTLPTPVSLSSYFRFDGNNGNCPTITGGNTGLIVFELVNSSGVAIAGTQVDPFAVPVCNGSNSPCMGCPLGAGPFMTYNTTYQLSPGIYTWRATVGNVNAALHLQDIGATYSWYEPATIGGQPNGLAQGGGLRIKRIIDHDGIDEMNNKTRRYDYHYFADPTNSGDLAEYSYGRRMSKPQYSFFSLSNEVHEKSLAPGCTYDAVWGMHLMRSSDSNNPLNGSAAGGAVGYDQVTELIGENGEFGKKVYQYINNPDFVVSYYDPVTGQSLPFRPPYNSNTVDPLNGSLLNEIDYVSLKGNYYKVKEINNQYTTIPGNENVVYAVENRPTPLNAHGDVGICPPNATANPCDNNSITLAWKTMKSEWSYLSSATQKIYNQGGDEAHFAQTTTTYSYDNNHLQLVSTVTNNSKGEQITTTNKYAQDYIIPGGANDAFTQGIQNLVNKHIVNVPIEKCVSKKKSDGTNIGAVSYVLTSYNNSMPSPALAYASMLTAPNTVFQASSILSTGLSKDPTYQQLITFDNYDASGNLTQQHKVNDMNHAYIWDYNNSLLIAEVSNAATNEVAHTSFEADGLGNWTLTDPARTPGGITGAQSYTIASGKTISKSGLTSGKNYIVSYWSKSGALNVNGVAAVTGVAKNGWTYFEHLLPTTTTSVNITSTTSINIDELRLYPSTALMTTYTYVPVIGITSVCSPNSIIQYYIYDALGRLKQIIDQDGNILKTVEYHLQQQVGS